MSKEPSALEQVLIDTIQQTTAGAKKVTGQAIDFVSAQIPDVVHQLLAWKMAEAIALILACVALIGVYFYFLRKIIAYHKKLAAIGKYYAETGFIFYYVGGTGVLLILPLIRILGSALTIIKIIVAPKLYLIEYAAELIK